MISPEYTDRHATQRIGQQCKPEEPQSGPRYLLLLDQLAGTARHAQETAKAVYAFCVEMAGPTLPTRPGSDTPVKEPACFYEKAADMLAEIGQCLSDIETEIGLL